VAVSNTMRTVIEAVLLVIGLSPALAVGQGCSALNANSASQAFEYLRDASPQTAVLSCVLRAFHQIASSPTDEAIPLLIELLGYKRPLSEGEQHGIFMHGNGPDVLYPAVSELFALGKPAEQPLLHFVAGNKDTARIERDNALYAMLIVHHGNAEEVVDALMLESRASGDEAERARLCAAAKAVAAKWCDDRNRVKCEDIQK
jgi:hypothetical protein